MIEEQTRSPPPSYIGEARPPTTWIRALLRKGTRECPSVEFAMIVRCAHQATRGNDEGFRLVEEVCRDRADCLGTERMAQAWRAIHHADKSFDGFASLCRIIESNGNDWVETCDEMEPPFEVIGDACASAEVDAKPVDNAPLALARYSLTSNRDEVAKSAVEQDFVIGRLALFGQLTQVNGPPNIGKSAVMLALLGQSVREDRIEHDKCFYLDFDTDANGLLQKIDFASKYGIHVLSDGYLGFSARKFLEEMDQTVRDGRAGGLVLVLDTLKQHTSIMSKEKSSAFASRLRQYSKAGATVIALGHTNKHPNADGKPVHAGTTDTVEQFDCCHLLYEVSVDQQAQTRTVMFENFKSRGHVAKLASYRYSVAEGLSYQELLESVVPVEAAERSAVQCANQRKADAPIIESIATCISAGVIAKMELIAGAAERSGASRRIVQAVLERYTGPDPQTHLWSFKTFARGEKRFSLLAPSAADDDRY